MTAINGLRGTDTLSPGDLVAVYSTTNGGTRKAPASAFVDAIGQSYVDQAEAQADAATATVSAFQNLVYPGVYAVDPTTRPNGSAMQDGDRAVVLVGGVPTEKLRVLGAWIVPNVDAVNLAAPSGSSLVGFLQAGAGAVGRDVEDELRQWLTPEQFGAVGDGIADDTDALMKVIAEAKATGNGVRLVKKYAYDGTMIVPTGVAVVGNDKRHLDSGRDYNLVYMGSGAGISIDKTTDASFQHLSRLENVFINYGGSDPSTDGIQQDLSSVLMRNVRAFNFTRHGFDLGTSIFSAYDNIFAQGCGAVGIRGVSTDPVFPGGQCVFINPQAYRCFNGMELDNYQTVEVVGGTLALNEQQQLIISGGQGIKFGGTFFEPELGNERTYFDKLVQVKGSTITSGTSKNVEFSHCNFYAGQSGSTPRYDFGLHIGNTVNVKSQHNVFNGFRAAGVKIVFDTNIVTNYEVGPNYYFDNVLDFDRAGSSSTGLDRTTTTETLTNQNMTVSGTGKLTVQGTHTAPMAHGSFNVWVDPDSKFLRKSGAPASNTDGTSLGFGTTQTTVGAAGSAAALPAAPTGYASVRFGGVEFVVPYYAKA